MSTQSGQTAEQRAQQAVFEWLNQNPRSEKQFLTWLRSEHLPTPDILEDSYVVLLRAISGEQRDFIRTGLIEETRKLLLTQPEWRDLKPGREEILYNLFHLAGGLGAPEQLGAPLSEMFDRRALTGAYRGTALRSMLLRAIIENQTDDSYRSIWLRMLDGVAHNFLGGDQYDGFRGLVFMPEFGEPAGPSMQNVRAGLVAVALFLDGQEDCTLIFNGLLREIRARVESPAWDSDLREAMRDCELPAWAEQVLADAAKPKAPPAAATQNPLEPHPPRRDGVPKPGAGHSTVAPG